MIFNKIVTKKFDQIPLNIPFIGLGLMGDWRKVFAVTIISVILLSIGLVGLSEEAFADKKGRTTSLEALGILQIAAHDLYNFDRPAVIENEDGKLNLSTLLENKTAGCTAFLNCTSFSDVVISNGGEPRNSDSILIFTVASELGEKYLELKAKHGEEIAYEKILKIYHKKVKIAFQQTFNQPFPALQDGDVTNNHNLALRSVHDFLPDTVKFNGDQVSVLNPILVGEKLSKSEFKQRSLPLDGQFVDLWNGSPIPLLFLDQTFGFDHTDNEFTFDEFMVQTSDGRYDSGEDVTDLIIQQFAKGMNFP